jgi:Periplasmic serine proteases (ClpP class)
MNIYAFFAKISYTIDVSSPKLGISPFGDFLLIKQGVFMDFPINDTIKALLNQKLIELETFFNADFLTYYGPIYEGNEDFFRQVVEQLVKGRKEKRSLYIILTTGGGSAIAVERLVNIIRYHYEEVNFIVPNYAYSAGTIFCMSGDNILMDYFSVLGPIDPQVMNKDGKFVPALGYLDKIHELLEKAKNNTLTQAEFIILKEFDLAELRGYEQGKELAIDQLKKWLVKYKFKNWTTHSTRPGVQVTKQEKETRAEEIASKLSDNNLWKSHGRPIDIEKLKNVVRLQIDNFGEDPEKTNLIRNYQSLVDDYFNKYKPPIFIHTRNYL